MEGRGPRIFSCGTHATLATSWTEANPGRRFYRCSNYGGAEDCGFFYWYDSPVSSRMRDVVSGLLRRIRRTEEQLKEQKAVTRRLKLWLVVLVGVLVAVVIKGQLVDVFLGGGAICRGFYVFLGGATACRVRSCGLLLDENGGVG